MCFLWDFETNIFLRKKRQVNNAVKTKVRGKGGTGIRDTRKKLKLGSYTSSRKRTLNFGWGLCPRVGPGQRGEGRGPRESIYNTITYKR